MKKYVNPLELLGKQIKYFDYLGLERSGKIIAFEPCPDIDDILYLYIEDEDPEFNIHNDIINGKNISYAELRRSNDIILD